MWLDASNGMGSRNQAVTNMYIISFRNKNCNLFLLLTVELRKIRFMRQNQISKRMFIQPRFHLSSIRDVSYSLTMELVSTNNVIEMNYEYHFD